MALDSLGMKQPIRRLEIQINNFNVAIPHHVDLLRRHKNNIGKYEAQKDWDKIHKEHVNVSRIIKQLKELLYQMDTLRSQVLDGDINQFDKLTSNARESILCAVKEYMDLQLSSTTAVPRLPVDEYEAEDGPLDQEQIEVNEEEQQRQQACLHAWDNLQGEIHQLHQLFVDFNKIVDEQKELVESAEEGMEEARSNVEEGEKFLQKAARHKLGMYPLAGAVIGTCIGGPIGLIAGLKAGGLAALGCGILGFTGASLLKKKQIEQRSSAVPLEPVKRSSSLPNETSKKEL